MKYAVIILMLAPFIFSCKKTKIVEVDTPVHDTTTVRDTVTLHDTTLVNAPTLIGEWSDGNVHNTQPLFEKDRMRFIPDPYFKYLANSDSIYLYGSNNMISSIYYYRISDKNDTLYLTGTGTASAPTKVYYRVH